MQALPIGKGELRREGKRVAILAFGSLLTPALQAGETLDATVVNMRFVKPLDEANPEAPMSLTVDAQGNTVASASRSCRVR